MKATFTFNLPEEQGEYNVFLQANNMHSAIFEFSNFLRARWKHHEPPTESPGQEYDEIREAFITILNENEVRLL